MEQLKGEFQKVIQEKPPKPAKKEKPEPEKEESQSNQDVEKVLQPILEQITDETEGLLLQDLKQRWFKISLCTQEEIQNAEDPRSSMSFWF